MPNVVFVQFIVTKLSTLSIESKTLHLGGIMQTLFVKLIESPYIVLKLALLVTEQYGFLVIAKAIRNKNIQSLLSLSKSIL